MKSIELTPPFVLREYKEVVRVDIAYDAVNLVSKQLVYPLVVPECPVKPQVRVQCLDAGNNTFGPVYVYDWKKEEFVEYDKDRHRIPKSAPKKPAVKPVEVAKPEVKSSDPVKVEKSPLDLSGSSKVELSSGVHAQDPPKDEKDKI